MTAKPIAPRTFWREFVDRTGYPRRVPSNDRSPRRRTRGVLLVLVAALMTVSACTKSQATVRVSASGKSSASPSATAKSGSTGPSTALTALQILLAKLPTFGAAPAAVPVALPTGGSVKIFYRMPVTAKVAFLTIDDGIDQMPVDLQVMKAAGIPFTMFLIGPVAAKNPSFFKQLVGDGGVIEDHTITHTDLKGKSYAFQQHEVCGAKTILTNSFGAAPTLFRPPYGDYDATTLKVVHDCGLQAAFYWSETVRGGKVYYQTSIHKIRPGDIILMHFRSTFPQDVLAALTAIHAAGLTPALLTSYIGPTAA
jgi:peptidoglycan/xylan/chitin deacetylase (PgdA/CDA1 family)